MCNTLFANLSGDQRQQIVICFHLDALPVFDQTHVNFESALRSDEVNDATSALPVSRERLNP